MKSKTDSTHFALIFAIVGAVVVYMGVRGIWEAHASNAWTAAQGKVLSSVVRSARSRNAHWPAVRYEYAVDGRALTSERVSFGSYESSRSADAAAVVARYPVGAVVTVYHDPGQPASSVLERGGSMVNYLLPLLGLGFMGAGGWLFKKARQATPSAI